MEVDINSLRNFKEDESKYTEDWMIKKFIRENRDRIRYCYPLKNWYIWDGDSWKEDKLRKIQGIVKMAVKKLYNEAFNTANPYERENLLILPILWRALTR